MCWIIFDKRVGPIKHVGWNFSKILVNMRLESVPENPSKITIINKKLELKVKNN